MEAWFLVTTKLKSELRVKQNLEAGPGLETFFPVYAARKAGSPIGLPLFPRYVFVRFDLTRDFAKVQYTPGVCKVVVFGETHIPVSDDVIACLRARCDSQDVLLPPSPETGQKVRVQRGIFDGCEGIIREKRGNRRVQLLLELAYRTGGVKVELDLSEVTPIG